MRGHSTLLLLLLLVACAAPALCDLRCPELSVEAVCSIASSGFEFSDGCNSVSCKGQGRYVSGIRWCRVPSSAEERRDCRIKAAAVFGRLGPFICSNMQPSAVCQSRSKGFRFFDGCNDIVCDSDGSFSVSTMRMCPGGNPEGAYCRFMAGQVSDVEGARQRRPFIGSRRRIWN